MTSKKLGIALLSLVVLAMIAVASVSAIPTDTANPFAQNIAKGDKLFVGESGLDITAALEGNPQIAWWAPGSSAVGGDAPEKVVEPKGIEIIEFYLDKATFETRTGAWYQYDNGLVGDIAFFVEKPSLKIGLYRKDQTTSIDGKKAIANEDGAR